MSTEKRASSAATVPVDPLESMWREGLPAALDGDAAADYELGKLIAQMFEERQSLRMLRGALFANWCELPNVTLDQACWLLLARDPWRPLPPSESEATYLRERHAYIRNRLECEVGRSLPALRPHLPSIAPRFLLGDVTRVAHAVGVHPVAAEVLAEFIEASGRANESKASLQRQRVQQRLQFHAIIVAALIAEKRAHTINPKPKARNTRRRYAGAAHNVEVDMTTHEYCKRYREAFLQAFKRPVPGSNSALVDDCRALNIAFPAHRPKDSKDRVPRRRSSGR